jgi:two-component system, OmpR family, response regulator
MVHERTRISETQAWKMRVLVVEDDASAAETLAELLRAEGHEVDLAVDGPAAVEAVVTRPPDVVILDIGLPGLDGWQVARLVHDQPAEKRPLLVAVTGRGEERDRLSSERAGIDLHLTKPFDPVQLRRLLTRFRSIIAED